MCTRFGLEGGAIYALSKELVQLLEKQGQAEIYIDLKKDLSLSQVLDKLTRTRQKNITSSLKRDLKLPKHVIAMLKTYLTKDQFVDLKVLSKHIKNFSLSINDVAPIDEAISTTGGIPISKLDEHFSIIDRPGHYAIGEMIDWNAPTGGYLLQACFSMGNYLATKLNDSHL